ncbi:MAG: hypothetical protein IJA84_02450 [Clostridia bacterium]|nr:hypothetical protein [Clostridia bacterium]
MGAVWVRRVLLAVAVAAAVVSIIQVVRLAPVPAPPQQEENALLPALEPQPVQLTEPTRQQGWTVGVWQGRVAVFEGASADPIRVMETPVEALPETDRLALERGIPVDDPVVLAGLLEDYGS